MRLAILISPPVVSGRRFDEGRDRLAAVLVGNADDGGFRDGDEPEKRVIDLVLIGVMETRSWRLASVAARNLRYARVGNGRGAIPQQSKYIETRIGGLSLELSDSGFFA
ncbi:MAG TPA: hypothetical protein VFV58_37030 [Blastocatellia bacterium]|jgi:hypothetical protein|nr:hypothetical protein [Blastocatellia bacterium]